MGEFQQKTPPCHSELQRSQRDRSELWGSAIRPINSSGDARSVASRVQPCRRSSGAPCRVAAFGAGRPGCRAAGGANAPMGPVFAHHKG